MLYIVHIYNACWEVVRYFVRFTIFGVPVSYPGDAITNPQTRTGKWPNKKVRAMKDWKFAEADESHRITDSANPKYPLTGETAGRQTWHLEKDANGNASKTDEATFNASENPNSSDKLFRQQRVAKWMGDRPNTRSKPTTAREAASKGISFYQMLQCDDGHWAGDYGGPMFLMPGLICTLYLTKSPFPPGRREAMVAYICNHQQIDGGWGTHIECASTMFGSVLSYTALRLLGEDPNAPHMIAGRKFIHQHGGALYAPSWAKFWLAAIGVYDWKGINSVPVEMWLLPRWFIFHPGKLWCHCRMVYLPMGYVYCRKYVPDVANDPILKGLREELFVEKYDSIDWNSYRQTCASIDEYSPLNPVMRIAQDALAVYERIAPYIPICRKMREWGLKFAIDYIDAEDIQTNFIDIGPVNKALNMLSVWIAGGCDNNNPKFQRHIGRVEDYLWVAEDGMKMQGYNGSQCWDTAFASQAIVESGFGPRFAESLRKSYSYFDRSQIKSDEDNREYWFRHVSKGGFPFSSAAHGWPISDCTAEGMKAVLTIHELNTTANIFPSRDQLISERRLCDGADVLLSYQNADGGWATYENNRGYGWYEMLNPSEVFGDIMIDYSYIECSSASVTALKAFQEQVGGYRTEEVRRSIARGRTFMKSIQRRDGSWYGSWGNCFCYGTWFGVEGLIAAGEPSDSPAIRKAVQFLLSKQNPNGGWGESYLACVNKAYPLGGTGELGQGQSGVVQTGWAMLTLMKAKCTDKEALIRGKNFLLQCQTSSGDWEQEGITGVFNRSCGITYTAYRNVFPIWALARYANTYEN